MSQRNLLILLLATVVSYACYVRGEQNPFARYVADGLATINRDSLERIQSRELFDGAMTGMVGVVNKHGDKHSEFLNENAADPLRAEIRQQFGGIGVRIGLEGDPPALTIVGPPDASSPAARAGLRAEDQITSIDGVPTAGLQMGDILKRMRGLPGTSVTLQIKRSSEIRPLDFELVREVVNIESVLGDRRSDDGSWHFLLEEDPRIAHIRIISFGERTAGEFERALRNAVAAGAQALVLDLRGDAGGALDAAVDVCKLLLPADKPIVETRGRDGFIQQRYKTTEDGPFLTIPIVVLVNQNSASAAEIVAACLQDHDRAAIAGQRSYGKGTVQQLIPVQKGKSLLKLTWASFWRPNGKKIHRESEAAEEETWGIVPDEGLERKLSQQEFESLLKYRGERDQIMPSSTSVAESEGGTETDTDERFTDQQLQIAVKYLQDKLASDSRQP